MLSVIIPSRNSPFLTKTIEDALSKATGDIEVIVNVDEKKPDVILRDPRVTYIFQDKPIGLRQGINLCVSKAKGEYIMKTDDHCMFGLEYDRILIQNMQPNWIVVPRRYALDAINWKIEEQNNGKYPVDYMYFDFPRKGKPNDDGTHGVNWKERREERKDYDIDDTPSMQGSCWFMMRDYFNNFFHGMSEVGYGQFAQETQELTFKCWLGGGEVKVNKKTWYAHLHKGKTFGRMYHMPPGNVEADSWSASHWLNNEEPGMIHKFEWLVDEKFPGMPTWPTDWKEQIKQMGWIK